MKKIFKKDCKFKKIFLIPHIRIASIILGCAVITLLASGIFFICENSFWYSIFANIFAGLTTGLVVCLISGIKQKNSSELNSKLVWLQELSALIKIYLADYNKLTRLKFDKFNCDENLYVFFYDAHTHANDINTEILQKAFDETIDFKPCAFCKEKLNYDAESLIPVFEDLHMKVEHIDVDCPSSLEIIKYFNEAHQAIKKLNLALFEEIRNLEIQIANVNKSII